MFRKLLREVWLGLKLERPTILVLRFGMTDHMMLNVTFGHWDALFMKWQL